METNYIYRDIEKIRKDFEEKIAEHSAAIAAWKAVERQTKKDGSDFASLAKNFKNARLQARAICGNDLAVGFRVGYKYETDKINITRTVQRNEDTTGRQLVKEPGLYPYYTLSVDEIFCRIEETIAWHEKTLAEYNEAMKKLEETFTNFAMTINAAINATKANTPIYYACIDWLHDAY